MIYTRPASTKAVLFLHKYFVVLQVFLEPRIQNTRVDLGDAAHDGDAPVLQGVPGVLVFFRDRFYV